MNNYNSSHYYRSNPYKDTNNMPPMALKNRGTLAQSTMPQGQQFFSPTAKKHYNYAYIGEMTSENRSHVLGVSEPTPVEREAMQKSYFRSLNSQDIEGATTGTLVNQSIKNKMKAQQELKRRKELQKEQEGRKMMEYRQQQQYQYYQQQNYRKKAEETDILNSFDLENQRKRRENQLLKLAQQRKNYQIVDHPNFNKKIMTNSNVIQTIRPQQNNYHNRILSERQNFQQKAHKNQYYENTNSQNNQNAQKQLQNQNKNYYSIDVNQPYFEQNNREQQTYQNKNKNQYSIPLNSQQNQNQSQTQTLKTYRPQIKNLHYRDYYNNEAETKQAERTARMSHPETNQTKINQNYMKMPQFKDNQDFRRHNPTYLSYGSPTFAVASKNVVGF